MNLPPIKVRTPEIDEAFQQVIAAFGVTVSTQVASLLHGKRKVLVTVVAALMLSQVGLILVTLGIKDALVVAFPGHEVASVVGIGMFSMMVAAAVTYTLTSRKRAPMSLKS